MKSNEYSIDSIDDFMSVPQNRIDACLADFAEWLKTKHTVSNLLPGVEVKFGGFVWTDDGFVGVREVVIKNRGDTL